MSLPLPSTSAARAAFLRTELERHNRLYYIEARPEIGDTEFDRLMDELIALEKKDPSLVTPDSPTQRVGGAPLPSFESVNHSLPMLSLDNTYERSELNEFDNSLRRLLGDEFAPSYVVEPKVDGLAFSLRYEHGVLTLASTRGDGTRGDNVTANVRTIRCIPLRIPTDAPLIEVRGEIYMPKQGFADFVRRQEEAGEEPFRNPRNAAAGSLKLLDPRTVAQRPLAAVLYNLGHTEGVEVPATHSQLLDWLASLGFPTPPRVWQCPDIATVLTAIDELDSLRHDFVFETDGAVIKLDDRLLYDTLGTTAKAPRWARAFKYQPDQAETVIEAITVQVGRTGVLTPVAELRTVRLAGSDISRATLHNEDEIQRKDVRVGDHVMIEKAGDVIPAVVRVLPEKRTGAEQVFEMPPHCPACGEPAVRRPGEVALRCVSLLCPAQLIARVIHFAARDALDIEGLGGRVAEALVEQGWISDPLDLFDQHADWLGTLNLGTAEEPRVFGSKNATRLVQALERSRSLSLARWLFALGIPNIGTANARQVAACHRDMQELADSPILRDLVQLYDLQEEAAANNPRSAAIRSLDLDARVAATEKHERLNREIEQLGEALAERKLAKRESGGNIRYTSPLKPETVRAVYQFFQSENGRNLMDRLQKLEINPVSDQPTAAHEAPLAGHTYVITGTLASGGRTEIANRLRQLGAKVTGSVSRQTTALIAGENAGGSKYDRAQELDIPILSEADYLELLQTSADLPDKAVPEKTADEPEASPQQTTFW